MSGQEMTLFFFDLHECGNVTQDRDGAEAEDLEAAREIALTAARELMCAEISTGTLCLSCFIEIRDEKNRILDRVDFQKAVQISGLDQDAGPT